MNTRNVFLWGPITTESSLVVVEQLSDWDDPINLYINSKGGSFYDALAIVNAIRMRPSPVNTIALGACCDDALLVLMAGTGKRAATSNTLTSYRQSSINQTIGFGELDRVWDIITNIMRKYSTSEHIADVIAKFYDGMLLTPVDCKRLGMIDLIASDIREGSEVNDEANGDQPDHNGPENR